MRRYRITKDGVQIGVAELPEKFDERGQVTDGFCRAFVNWVARWSKRTGDMDNATFEAIEGGCNGDES